MRRDRTRNSTLYQLWAKKVDKGTGAVPTLIEWDTDAPAWPILKQEAKRAEAIMLSVGLGAEHGDRIPVPGRP
jgi:uncharacterized protein (UPF0276 family)